ncbi:hypothetical protein BGX34_006535, partial [Mortierella sp. NVP85]
MALPFWKHPDHRIPTLGLYRQLLKTCLSLPTTYTDQPGPRRQPIPRVKDKEIGKDKRIGKDKEMDKDKKAGKGKE